MKSLLILLLCALVIVFGYLAFQGLMDEAYCECMGRQPFIITKFFDGRCLMRVVNYDEMDVVQYLFICEGRCR